MRPVVVVTVRGGIADVDVLNDPDDMIKVLQLDWDNLEEETPDAIQETYDQVLLLPAGSIKDALLSDLTELLADVALREASKGDSPDD